MGNSIKYIIRKILSTVSYVLYYQFFYKKFEVNKNGHPLKKGITAIVVAKDEATIISLALKSLIGFADQVICIDNGSTDNTLDLMRQFEKDNAELIEIKVLSMPGALLGDCRQKGLDLTDYNWHLRWDADMVFKTTGHENCHILRKKALSSDRPRAIQLPRTNLFGDFHHTSKLYEVVDPGEPILVKYCNKIVYKEYGKFDTIRLPFYYKSVKESLKYYFHCNGLKSDLRLVFRNCYFDWRNAVNTGGDEMKNMSFEDFKPTWLLNRYGTLDEQQIKFRYQKELMLHVSKYDVKKYGEYPQILKEAIQSKDERFRIEYNGNKPVRRIDKLDTGIMNYVPTEEDKQFDPMKIFIDVLSKDKIEKLNIP
jgi:glycosyltransferase involved in cell wall biosynthesis